MASPQKENGYTPIANEILDRLMTARLNGTQFRIVMAVWRYTYGFSRKEAELAESFIADAVGIARPNVNREIKPLFDKKILTGIKGTAPGKPSIISFNKNYDEWELLSNPITAIESDTCIESDSGTAIESDSGTAIESDTQDKQYIKQNIKQDARTLFESLWRLYPEKKGKARVTDKTIKALATRGYDVMKRCIDRYIADKPDWKEWQHGSTFFTSGYIDYLDENYHIQALGISPVTPKERIEI